MIKRIISLFVAVLTAAIFSVNAAAVMNLNIVGSRQISTDEAYDHVIDYLNLFDAEDVTGFKSEHPAIQSFNDMVQIYSLNDTTGATEYYWLVWADDNDVLQLAYIHVDDETGEEDLQVCTDPRVTVGGSSSSDTDILDKGLNDAGSILTVCGDVAAFVVTNELCLISLSFILVARGISLLRKMVRVTPR